jgi:hypothetical protein
MTFSIKTRAVIILGSDAAELAGWPILGVAEGDNDGLVSHQSAMLSGVDNHNGDANTAGFFWSYDHKELVEKADVATLAASKLR